jgi:hypothetical protein
MDSHPSLRFNGQPLMKHYIDLSILIGPMVPGRLGLGIATRRGFHAVLQRLVNPFPSDMNPYRQAAVDP